MKSTTILPAIALLATAVLGAWEAPGHCHAADAAKPDAPASNTTATNVAAPPQVGTAAPDFQLESLTGGTVKLADTLAQGPVALVLLRGFPGYQCPLCTAQYSQLRANADAFTAAKATVLLVYPGPADKLKEHAQEFIHDKTLPPNFHLLLDPDFTFTNRYNLRWNAPHETSYPSTFVIDGKGKVLFAKISHSHGGRATATEILAALPKPG